MNERRRDFKKRTMTMRLNALVAAAAAFLVLAPSLLRASAVVPYTVEEMIAVADEIVHVTVADKQSEWYNGKIVTRHAMKVQDVIASKSGRLKDAKKMQVVTPGGKVGSIGALVPGMTTFEQGEEMILFMDYPMERFEKRQKARGNSVKIDKDSPLVQSPRVIGGFQGRFQILRDEYEATINGKSTTVENATIFREVPGKAIKKGSGPSLDEFKSEIRDSLSGKKANDSTKRLVHGAGEYEVPKMSSSTTAFRFFDPPTGGSSVPVADEPKKAEEKE